MHITAVNTVLLTGQNTGDPFFLEARRLRSVALIELQTDGEHTGIGETYAGYFCPEVVPPLVEFYAPILLGVDILETDIHTLYSRMYQCGNYWGRVGLGPAVLTGIEAALWDLKGKALGLPVWQLLGGKCHDRLRAYATGGPSNWPPDRLKEKIDLYLAQGYTAFKVATGYYDPRSGFDVPANSLSAVVDMEARKADLMRQHVGPDVAILMDGHMGNASGQTWDLPTARAVLQALEPYDLFFFEEPLHYTDPWGYAELARSTTIPVAGGECLTTLNEFRQYADLDALTIAQPDAAWVGGLTEFLKIARLFESRKKRVATHSWGAGVAHMQNVHAGFAAPNTCILETPPVPGPLHKELWGDSFDLRDGYLYPPTAPGLGVRLTDEIKAKFAFIPGSGEFNSVPGKPLTT
ncbi:MAG: mandelate racemase/muconate lactonizing enzyme family protein [Anaerolineae bacterium]|nr:mandelate racemase/muconate lactonizing enzyme family protein [Anaerolineae bacterium]